MNLWTRLRLLLVGGLLSGPLFLSLPDERASIYWGAWVRGDTYGVGDAPWDERALLAFERNAGKQVSIVHWGQPWWHCYSTCGYQLFHQQQAQYERVRQHGAIPLVDWASWDYDAPAVLQQPAFALDTIIRGQHDNYIRQWATEAREWGHPFFLRFNWEMNGNWFPWSERVNGNRPGEFVAAWRHVHKLFGEVGADNVTWVWCPNVLHGGSVPLERLYPGDAYVDWTCMDGYNWGHHPAAPDRWRSFQALFEPTYRRLLTLAPHKPIMIGEVGSSEVGGSKEEWIRQALTEALPHAFPRVKALVWFNWHHDGVNWTIESSPAAQAAFAQGIAGPYYAGNNFSTLPRRKLTPPAFPLRRRHGLVPVLALEVLLAGKK